MDFEGRQAIRFGAEAVPLQPGIFAKGLVNAVTGEVKSAQTPLSGNPTSQASGIEQVNPSAFVGTNPPASR